MAIREELINGGIADIIGECVRGTQWTLRAENTSTIEGSDLKPDILITRPSPEPPVVIENKFKDAHVKDGCLRYLGKVLRPELGGHTVRTVIGVVSPTKLQKLNYGADATTLLRTASNCDMPLTREHQTHTRGSRSQDSFPAMCETS